MQINELYVELTRRCNLRCTHCFYGEAQNAVMDKNTLNLTFQVFKDVDCLVAGDGEPFLNFDGVKRMISKVIKGKIRAKTFFPGVLPVRDLDSTAEVTVCRAETGIESTTNDVWNCAIIFDGLNLFLELKRIWNSLRNL